jgi:hypothetical protein
MPAGGHATAFAAACARHGAFGEWEFPLNGVLAASALREDRVLARLAQPGDGILLHRQTVSEPHSRLQTIHAEAFCDGLKPGHAEEAVQLTLNRFGLGRGCD